MTKEGGQDRVQSRGRLRQDGLEGHGEAVFLST